MVLRTRTKLSKYSGGRHLIHLPKELATDSQFPFQPNEEVVIAIEGDSLVVRRKK